MSQHDRISRYRIGQYATERAAALDAIFARCREELLPGTDFAIVIAAGDGPVPDLIASGDLDSIAAALDRARGSIGRMMPPPTRPPA